MAEQTTNLKLSKPSLTDGADIRVLNSNFDIIDKAIGELQTPSINHNEFSITKDNIFMNDKEFVSVVEKSGDGNFWYVKYSDGTLIQGGIILSTNTVLTFPTPFANEDYFVTVGAITNGSYANGGVAFMYNDKKTSGINGLKTSYNAYTSNSNGWYITGSGETDRTRLAPQWLCIGSWK